MIPAGTRLTFNVSGSVHAWFTSSKEDVHDIASATMDPYVNVKAITVTPTSTVITGTLDWTYSAVVVLDTISDHASVDDVASIVKHAFYIATDAVPVVAGPGDPAPGEKPKTPLLEPSWTQAIVVFSIVGGLWALLAYRKLG